jgi:hypothetical protein
MNGTSQITLLKKISFKPGLVKNKPFNADNSKEYHFYYKLIFAKDIMILIA